MTVWQVDFYRRPLQDESGNPLWELLICDSDGNAIAQTFCPQPQATADWLTTEIAALAQKNSPERIQAFRPQTVNLLESAAQKLGIPLEATRHTPALKHLLENRATIYKTLPGHTQQPYQPVKLEQPAPIPLPENLWGQQWRFAAIAATDLLLVFGDRPIPIRHLPEDLLPIKLQLASTTPIPGVIIDGGRQSMRLARWLEQSRPAALNYIPGDPDGLILEAGLVDRWVLTTFTDAEVAAAGRTFQQRQQVAKGLHFLLVQPDDSGVTYSGIWLLQK